MGNVGFKIGNAGFRSGNPAKHLTMDKFFFDGSGKVKNYFPKVAVSHQKQSLAQ